MTFDFKVLLTFFKIRSDLVGPIATIAAGGFGFVAADILQFKSACLQTQLDIDKQWGKISNKTSSVYRWQSYCRHNCDRRERGKVVDPVDRFQKIMKVDPDEAPTNEEMKLCISVNEARAIFKSWLVQCYIAQDCGLIQSEATLRRWQERLDKWEKIVKAFDDKLGDNVHFDRQSQEFKVAEQSWFITRYWNYRTK